MLLVSGRVLPCFKPNFPSPLYHPSLNFQHFKDPTIPSSVSCFGQTSWPKLWKKTTGFLDWLIFFWEEKVGWYCNFLSKISEKTTNRPSHPFRRCATVSTFGSVFHGISGDQILDAFSNAPSERRRTPRVQCPRSRIPSSSAKPATIWSNSANFW